MKWRYPDEVYNNQFVGHLTALLSIARLFDNEQDLTPYSTEATAREP
jgi:hypothetical protein